MTFKFVRCHTSGAIGRESWPARPQEGWRPPEGEPRSIVSRRRLGHALGVMCSLLLFAGETHAQDLEPGAAPIPVAAPPAPPPAGTVTAPADKPPPPPAPLESETKVDSDAKTIRAPPDSNEKSGPPREEMKSAPTEVTVVGTRIAKTAGSAHVVRRKDLERFQYDDPTAALRSVPGVYARGEDGIGLRPNIGIRGVNPDRSKKITLLEDGVLVAPAAYSAPAAYYFPLMARIERVFVIKGPAAITQGPQTVGGAINFATRAIPASTQGMIDAGTGEYGYNKLHGYFGTSDEQTGFLVEAAHIGADGFKQLPNGADTGFYRNEAMFKGRYVVDPRSRSPSEFLLKFTYSDELSNETYLGLTDADFRANPLQRYGASQLDRMKNYRTGFSLTHTIEPAPKLSITTTAYRSDFSRAWRKVNRFRGTDLFGVLSNPADARNAVFAAVISGRADSSSAAETLLIGPNQRDFVSQGVETRVRWDVATGPVGHRLEYGMRLHHDRVERRHSEDPFRLLGGQLVPEGGPTVVQEFNEAWTEALALHVADAITWQRLTLTPGLRAEAMRSAFVDRAVNTEQRGLTSVLLPGVGLFYAFTDTFGAFAGIYRGFSPPAPGSAQRVRSELSINYEGGARWSDRIVRVEAIGFYNDYSNITDVCTFSSGCTNQNVDRQYDGGKARIYGVEGFAQLAPTLGEWTIPFTGAYTFTRAEFQSSFSSEDPIFGDVVAGDEMPYVPRHQLNALVGVESRHGGAAAGATYVSAMREEAGSEPLANTVATDEQLVFDVSAHYQLFKPLRIYAHVRNLLDDHSIVSHRPFGARPNAPRWVQVGVKATF
jgi:Fe(3+) dicitrate transport protein